MRRNNRGFTLVELIATVVVITLVMGIAIPYVVNLINNSKDNSRVLALNNIKTSARYYTDDNKSEIMWTKEGSESEKSYTCVSINDLINKGYLKKTDIKSDLSITTTTNIIVQKDENGVIYNEEIDENICKNRPNVLPLPTNKLCTSATYSGSVNNLIDINKIGREELRVKYKFTGHENKINAGDYKITVELNSIENDNLYWEDGTTTAKEITCSIKKAIPEITVVPVGSDSSISENTTATLKSNVEGKVSLKSSNTNYVTASIDGNTIVKNSNKTININKISSRNTNTYLTITVNPTDFKNYYSGSTVYTVGKLTNIETKVPTSAYCQDLTYNGTTRDLVYAPGSKDSPKVAGYTFIEKTAMNAGTYTVTARLKWGYVWSDKTKDDKTIKCTIKKADPTLSLSPTSGTTIVGYPMTFNEAATVKGRYTVTSNDTSIATVAQESNNEIAVSTNNKVTVTPKKVGNTKIVVKFNPTDAVNYNSRLGTYSVNILNQVSPPTEAKCSSPIYNGASQTIVKTADTGYTWSTNTTRTAAGSQNVTASLSTGYRWSNNTTADTIVSCKIDKRAITITATNQSKVYDGTVLVANGTCNDTNSKLVSGHQITCTNTGSITNAGTATKTLSTAVIKSGTTNVSSNYTITKVNGNLTVTKKTPTVTLGAKTSNYTGSAIAANTATVSPNSGGSITYTYYTNSACSTSTSSTSGGAASNGAAPKNAGTYYVKATVAAKGNYGSASSSCTTHTINKVASSFNCDNKKYTGATLTIAKDASGCTLSGHQKKDVGSYTVTCNGDGNHNNATAKNCTIRYPNCTVTYDPNGGTFTTHNSNDEKIQTVAFGSYFGDETYGMRNANGGQYSAVRNGYHIDSNNAWKCDSGCVYSTYSETKMYQAQEICASLTSTSADKSVTLKVNWKSDKTDATCPTVSDYSGTYNGESHTIDITKNATGGTLKYSTDNSTWSTTKPTRTDAGTTTISLKVVGDSTHNSVDCGSNKIVIKKKTPSVSLTAKTATYTGSAIAANTATVTPNSGGAKTYTYYTDSKCTTGATTTAPTNAGTYYVKATVAAKGNYNSASSSCTTHKINKATPTCPAIGSVSEISDGEKHYITITGGKGGTLQTKKDDGSDNSYEWKNGNEYSRTKIGVTTISVKIVADNNYNGKSCGSGTITIKAPKCNITFNANGGEWGATDPETTYSVEYDEKWNVWNPTGDGSHFKAYKCGRSASNWVRSGATTTVSTGTIKGQEICKDLTETSGNKSVTLKVNWSGTYNYTKTKGCDVLYPCRRGNTNLHGFNSDGGCSDNITLWGNSFRRNLGKNPYNGAETIPAGTIDPIIVFNSSKRWIRTISQRTSKNDDPVPGCVYTKCSIKDHKKTGDLCPEDCPTNN